MENIPLREYYVIPRYGVVFVSKDQALKAAIINIDPETKVVTRTEMVHVREVPTDGSQNEVIEERDQ